jgi:uncharacterized protein YbjT (DUF2867 family)
MNILVIGATGTLGQPVANEMIRAGLQVTIMSRNANTAAHYFQGVKIVQGDLRNKADIEKTLENQDIIYLNLSVKQTEKPGEFHTESDGIANLLDVAKQKKVKQIVYLSSIIMQYNGMNNFNWWVFDVKQKAVQLLKESGIHYTIFYPSAFMESLFIQKQGSKIMLAGESNHPMYMIAAEDYAKQVVRSLQRDSGNNEYYVQGPVAYTMDHAARVFVNHYKKEKLGTLSVPLVALKFAGLFNQRMNYGSRIVEALNNYPETFMAQSTWDRLGKPEISLEKFAQIR